MISHQLFIYHNGALNPNALLAAGFPEPDFPLVCLFLSPFRARARASLFSLRAAAYLSIRVSISISFLLSGARFGGCSHLLSSFLNLKHMEFRPRETMLAWPS